MKSAAPLRNYGYFSSSFHGKGGRIARVELACSSYLLWHREKYDTTRHSKRVTILDEINEKLRKWRVFVVTRVDWFGEWFIAYFIRSKLVGSTSATLSRSGPEDPPRSAGSFSGQRLVIEPTNKLDRQEVTGYFALHYKPTSEIVLEFKWSDIVVPSAKSTSRSDSITSATNSLRENLS